MSPKFGYQVFCKDAQGAWTSLLLLCIIKRFKKKPMLCTDSADGKMGKPLLMGQADVILECRSNFQSFFCGTEVCGTNFRQSFRQWTSRKNLLIFMALAANVRVQYSVHVVNFSHCNNRWEFHLKLC